MADGDAIGPACAACGAQITHRRADGTLGRACSPGCWRRMQLSDARLRIYGDPSAPWALHAPAYGPHLPGRLCEMVIADEQPAACSLAGSTTAHGLVATLTRHPHLARDHHHALWPDPLGGRWWVLMPEESAKYVAHRRFVHTVARRTSEVRFGPPIRLRTPAPGGARRLRLETQTPIVIRSAGSTLTRTEPDALHLASALGGGLLRRLGLIELPREWVGLRLIDRQTRPWIGRIDRGGKIGGDGRIRGWHGIAEIEASPLGAWLLDCAELIGLGGRTGYGFGRVRITEMDRG